MNLIEPLVAGVKGAENGTAQLFIRGSTIRATYFTDFEGTDPITSGVDVVLDVNGGAEVYVDVLTTVRVFDKAGTVTIREFVAGRSAPALEVRSPSFTGTSYADAAGATVTGASQPTTAQAIFDLWKTNSGAIDWKVLVDGSSKTLQSAIAAFSGLFYNVKDPEFGAKGDGTTDDLSAITAAGNVAQAANGGIVFFPPGTYRITNEWSVPTKVSVLGVGPNASVIAIDDATNGTFTFAGSTASSYRPFQSLEGLYFRAIQANTGVVLTVEDANLLVRNCTLGDGVNVNGKLIATGLAVTSANLNVDACAFVSNADTELIDIEDINTISHISRCLFTPNATMNMDMITMRAGTISRCTFLNGPATAGSFKCIGVVSSGSGGTSVYGCNFQASGGAAISTAIHMGALTSRFAESANVYATTNKITGIDGGDHNKLVSLSSSRLFVQDTGATGSPVACDTDNFDTTYINRSVNTDFTFNLGTPIVGHFHTVIVHADGGGNITAVTSGTNTKGNTEAITDDHFVSWHYKAIEISSGIFRWQQCAENGDTT